MTTCRFVQMLEIGSAIVTVKFSLLSLRVLGISSDFTLEHEGGRCALGASVEKIKMPGNLHMRFVHPTKNLACPAFKYWLGASSTFRVFAVYVLDAAIRVVSSELVNTC